MNAKATTRGADLSQKAESVRVTSGCLTYARYGDRMEASRGDSNGGSIFWICTSWNQVGSGPLTVGRLEGCRRGGCPAREFRLCRALVNELVSEVEAIIANAEQIDPDNDKAFEDLLKQINEYLHVHERLRPLKQLLLVMRDILDELKQRAGRLLQTPSTKKKKKEALETVNRAYDDVMRQVEDLYVVSGSMHAGTGYGGDVLKRIQVYRNASDRSRRAWDDLIFSLRREVGATGVYKLLEQWAQADTRLRIAFY